MGWWDWKPQLSSCIARFVKTRWMMRTLRLKATHTLTNCDCRSIQNIFVIAHWQQMTTRHQKCACWTLRASRMDALDCDLCGAAGLIKIQLINGSVLHAHSQKKILHGLTIVFSAKVNYQDLLSFLLCRNIWLILCQHHIVQLPFCIGEAGIYKNENELLITASKLVCGFLWIYFKNIRQTDMCFTKTQYFSNITHMCWHINTNSLKAQDCFCEREKNV